MKWQKVAESALPEPEIIAEPVIEKKVEIAEDNLGQLWSDIVEVQSHSTAHNSFEDDFHFNIMNTELDNDQYLEKRGQRLSFNFLELHSNWLLDCTSMNFGKSISFANSN